MILTAPGGPGDGPFFRLTKVKGHITEEEVENGDQERDDKEGNDRADDLAVEGRKRHALEDFEVDAYYERVRRGVLTQSMMLKTWLARCHFLKHDIEGEDEDDSPDSGGKEKEGGENEPAEG